MIKRRFFSLCNPKLKYPSSDIEAEEGMIGLEGSPTQVVKIFSPPKKSGGVTIDGTHPLEAARELVLRLSDQKVI